MREKFKKDIKFKYGIEGRYDAFFKKAHNRIEKCFDLKRLSLKHDLEKCTMITVNKGLILENVDYRINNYKLFFMIKLQDDDVINISQEKNEKKDRRIELLMYTNRYKQTKIRKIK